MLDFRIGSLASFSTRSPDICFIPHSGIKADIAGGRQRSHPDSCGKLRSIRSPRRLMRASRWDGEPQRTGGLEIDREGELPQRSAKKAGTFRWLNRWLTWERPTIRTKSLMISGRSGRI